MTQKVSIVKCENYDENLVYEKVKEALKLIDFNGIKKGSKVLIKPNVILGKDPSKAATTHPSIINAVCKILHEMEAEIWIGESSGSLMFGGTRNAIKTAGVEEVAKKWNAKLIYFETTEIIKKNLESDILKEVELAAPMFEADYVINLPKLKTHRFTQFTCAMKNLYGCIPGSKKRDYHSLAQSEKKFGDLLVEIYKQLKVDLVIVDGIIGMEGDGPTAGNPNKSRLIFAGNDCVATDLVVSKTIGFKKEEIQYLNSSIKQGLCPEFEVVGNKNISVKYKKPKNLIGKFLPGFIRNKIEEMLIPEVLINQKTCRKCMVCYNSCPEKAIKLRKDPKKLIINQDECIKCFCCHELCPYESIDLKDSFIIRNLKKIFKYTDTK